MNQSSSSGPSRSKKFESWTCSFSCMLIIALKYWIISFRSTKQVSLSVSGFICFRIMFSWSSFSAYKLLSWPTSSNAWSNAGLAESGKQNCPGKSIRAFTVLEICGGFGFGLICWNSSNRVQPSDHISWALSYYLDNNISSGARYQRVPTLSDKWRGFFLNISLFCCTFWVIKRVNYSLSMLLFSCLYFQKESRKRFVLQLPGPTTG